MKRTGTQVILQRVCVCWSPSQQCLHDDASTVYCVTVIIDQCIINLTQGDNFQLTDVESNPPFYADCLIMTPMQCNTEHSIVSVRDVTLEHLSFSLEQWTWAPVF